MTDRWRVLAALTFARTVMGFQFQTVAASAVPLLASFQLSYAGLGTLVGLYLLPGLAVALPGGLIAQRFGDKNVVCAGLFAMALGGGLMAGSQSETALMAGRILSGSGAVVLNVLVTKMVTDWFEGKETVTALGVLVTSWPLGIAIALMSVPPLVASLSWRSGMASGAILALAALICVWFVYRMPSGQPKPSVGWTRMVLSRSELGLAVSSGMVWALFNMGLIVLLTFGPAWLSATGTDDRAAGAIFSLISWLVIPAIPVGAFLAERLRAPTVTMLSCFFAASLAIAALPTWGASVLLLSTIALLFGPPAGLIMAMPGQAVPPERRAAAMGIYFSCYYVGMGVVPAVAGFSRDATDSASAPIYVAAGMLCLAAAAVLAFRLLQSLRPARLARPS